MAFAVEMDVTSEESVARGINACVREFGGLDMIVSNAGKAPPSFLIGECSTAVLKEQVSFVLFFLCS